MQSGAAADGEEGGGKLYYYLAFFYTAFMVEVKASLHTRYDEEKIV